MLGVRRVSKLRSRLFLILSGVVVAICVIGFGALRWTTSMYDRQLFNASARLLNLSAASVENELRRIEELSQAVLADPHVQGPLRAVKESAEAYEGFQARSAVDDILITHALSEPYIKSINLVDMRGNQISSGVYAQSIPEDRLEAIRREAEDAEGRIVWMGPVPDDDSLLAARLVRQIRDLTLEPLGLLIIRIDMRQLFALFSPQSLDGTNLHIFSDSGTLFASGPRVDRADVAADLARGGTYDMEVIDDRRYIVSYTRPRSSGWTYVYLLPYENVYQQTLWVNRLSVLLYAAVVAGALWASVRFMRSITRPVENLVAEMRRVERGDFSLPDHKDAAYGDIEEIDRLYQTFRTMTEHIETLIEENYSKQLLLKDTQYKALQAQINPHFLYNTLDTVRWMARLADQERIATMVEALGTLLRRSISRKDVITIREELELVESYMAIQRIRYDDRLCFEMEVDPESLDAPIPKLALQPVVENAIQHGLEKSASPVSIRIRSRRRGDGIRIEVEDNGPGMDEKWLERARRGEVASEGLGIGLNNIDERVKMLFGEAYGIDISSRRGEGTLVALELPGLSGASA